MTIDLSTIWEFNKPEASEEHFRSALAAASGDDVLILQTQIARTYGLRKDFVEAQKILSEIEPQIHNAGGEAQAHYYLELGRTYSSATHSPDSQTPEARESARSAYMHAFELAQNGKLDALAIDALHMMPFIDTSPQEQIDWNRKAISVMQASSQPEAKKWAGSLHNNIGYALHLAGQYDDALAEFKLALAAHEKNGKTGPIRIAHWMIAWTLRALGKTKEAIEIQLRLEKECDEARDPDPYVFEELELLYQAINDTEKAEYYAARRKAII